MAMLKPQKRLPAGHPGLNIILPSILQAGTRYEDLPLSPPDQMPTMISPSPFQQSPWQTSHGLPLSSNNPYFQPKQERKTNLSPFENVTRRVAPPSPPLTPPAKQPCPAPKASSGQNASGSNALLAPHMMRQRSTSAPPPKSRYLPPRVAQDGHESIRPPQYNPEPLNDDTKSPSTQRKARQPCPPNCQKCGKKRTKSLAVLRQGEADLFAASKAQAIIIEPLHLSKKCGPNCTKCGKRRSSARSAPSEETLSLPLNTPTAMPQAHTRSVSEGAPKPSSPLRPMPGISSASFLGPTDIQHRSCHKCGKPKRPASMPTPTPQAGLHISETRDWPLPASTADVHTLPTLPIIMSSFENNRSVTTITPSPSPFIANGEDSPLIAKRPTEFITAREASTPGSHARFPARRSSVLIRRISNALRPAPQPLASNPPTSVAGSNPFPWQTYLTVPATEDAPENTPDNTPRPFSFIGAANDDDFEMTDLRKSNPSSVSSSINQAVAPANAAAIDQAPAELAGSSTPSISPRRLYSPIPESDLEESRDYFNTFGGDNTTMRRAVSGSIRRFKSLRGAHRNWYRSDMDVSSVGYGYGYDYEGGRAVDVY